VRAEAALYEFTLRGVVTDAVFGDVPVGAPFTIRYMADSTDLSPDPTGGRFAATNATITFPDFTITADGAHPEVLVNIRDGVSIQSFSYGDTGGPNWSIGVSCAFPAGTISTDALPLFLPLSSALFARVRVFPILTPQYQGDITSYESVQVPEPVIAYGALIFAIMKRRSRWCTSG
jgi:hypothetical protein